MEQNAFQKSFQGQPLKTLQRGQLQTNVFQQRLL